MFEHWRRDMEELARRNLPDYALGRQVPDYLLTLEMQKKQIFDELQANERMKEQILKSIASPSNAVQDMLNKSGHYAYEDAWEKLSNEFKRSVDCAKLYEKTIDPFKAIVENVQRNHESLNASIKAERMSGVSSIERMKAEIIAGGNWKIATEAFSKNYSEIINSTSDFKREMENLFAKSSSAEINQYHALYKQINFSSIIDVASDIAGEFYGEVDEEEFSEMQSILNFVKMAKDNIPQLTEKDLFVFMAFLSNFVYTIRTIDNGTKSGALAPIDGALMVMSVYFAFVIAVYTIFDKKK